MSCIYIATLPKGRYGIDTHDAELIKSIKKNSG